MLTFHWKNLIERTLIENLIEYWELCNDIIHQYYWWRFEKLANLKIAIQKKWPKKLFMLKIFLFFYEKKDLFFYPSIYMEDTETYFKQLTWWKVSKLERLLQRHPQFKVKKPKQKRQKKIYGYLKPLRL